MAAKEMMVVGLVRVRAKVEAHAAASPRPSERVRRMQSTPMGPTGAAMDRPMIRPRRKMAGSTERLGHLGGRAPPGRGLERGLDGRDEERLVCGGVVSRGDLPALVDDHRVGRPLESEAVGHAEARIEGGGIGRAMRLQEGPGLTLGIIHLYGEHLHSAVLVALIQSLDARGLRGARLAPGGLEADYEHLLADERARI